MLLVEDDAISGAAMTLIFRRQGFEVTHVTTVAEGLIRLSEQPDLVVLDLMLPDGDGGAILQHIRNYKLPVRVMVTTAVGDPQRLQDILKMKPDLLLQKPIDISRLLMGMELPN